MKKGPGEISAEQTPPLLPAAHADRKPDQLHRREGGKKKRQTYQAMTGIMSTPGDIKEVIATQDPALG